MSIERLPVRYRRPQETTPRESWDSPEPSDLMTWEVCLYLRLQTDDGCMQCPRWEDDEVVGRVQRGCRGLAEEACRVMMAVQRREGRG